MNDTARESISNSSLASKFGTPDIDPLGLPAIRGVWSLPGGRVQESCKVTNSIILNADGTITLHICGVESELPLIVQLSAGAHLCSKRNVLDHDTMRK